MVLSLSEKYHQALFPEEYDFCYDSNADANERKKGINPMSREYQLIVNFRRQQLGFDAFDVESNGSTDTMAWVEQMVIDARTSELDDLILKFELGPITID